MPPAPAIAPPRGRLDHLLPQGYLEGFTNPSTPGRLSVFSIERQRWFESTPRKVAAINGFYDYSPDSAPDQTADQAFKEFEDRFPNVRRELVASGFSGWQSHLDFLLRYAQMLRARSELFREQTVTNARQQRIVRVKEVLNETTLSYEELTETVEEREKIFRKWRSLPCDAKLQKVRPCSQHCTGVCGWHQPLPIQWSLVMTQFLYNTKRLPWRPL
jgi:Protein of unknown function (DUF4238)